MLDQVLIIIGVTLLIMVSPGPDMVLVLRNTLVGGRGGGMSTSLGILSGNLVHISYCVAGIGWLISQSILAFNVLKYAGAAYLLWLGIASFRAGTERLDPGAATSRRTERGWFLQGFVNNLLNPKGTLFYLGLFTVIIEPGTSAAGMLLLIATTVTVSALFWIVFVFTLDRPGLRRFIERWQIAVHRMFGGLLVFLGVRVAFMER